MGLMVIKTRGGRAIARDPRNVTFDTMPRTALRLVHADHVVPSPNIAPLVVQALYAAE